MGYLTSQGYSVESEQQHLDRIWEKIDKVFPNMSKSPSNLVSVMASIMASIENQRDYDTAIRYGGAYIATATGDNLSKAVRTAGIYRYSGTKAYGSVEISKLENISQIVIPADAIIENGDVSYRVKIDNAIISSNDSVIVEIESLDVGSIANLPKESKFDSVTYILGVDKIVAVTDVVGGSDKETDAILRERYYKTMSGYNNSSLAGIVYAVENVNGVTKVSGEENNGLTSRYITSYKGTSDFTVSPIDNANIPNNTFRIFVKGGLDSDIANSIFDTKPAGIRSVGDISNVVNYNGNEYTISFSRFNEDKIYFNVFVVIDKTIVPTDYESQLMNEIISYCSDVEILQKYKITSYLSNKFDWVVGFREFYFGKTPTPLTDTDIVANVGYIFSTETSNIAITTE